MFIRRTKTRTTDSGEQDFSYRLVDTFRIADRVRQRTLLNLGSGFTFPPEPWKALTQRIFAVRIAEGRGPIPCGCFRPGGRGAEPEESRRRDYSAAAAFPKLDREGGSTATCHRNSH